jgi:hypothetical protein
VVNINGNYNTESDFDFINIYSGSGVSGTLLMFYHGVGTINYTGTPGQTLTVQFTSDGSVVSTGFDLAVTFTGSCAGGGSDEVMVPLTGNNMVACGTNVTLMDHAGALNYANNASGYTVLEATGLATININGNYQTEEDFDFITLYDGPGITGPELGQYHGNGSLNFGGMPGQTVTVMFTSDESVVANGFALTVTYTGSCINVAVPELISSQEMLVWPNPAQDLLNVPFNGDVSGSITYVVLDHLGREVLSGEEKAGGDQGLMLLNVSNLASGPYVLRCSSGDHTVFHRFVKQ